MRVLEERPLSIEMVGAFASRPRPGAARFRDDLLDVAEATDERLKPYDVVFFAGGEDASEAFAPTLEARGTVVIDNSSTFRMREDVPLVVPEVNPEAIRPEHRLFPVANCTAIILCTALAPVRDRAGLQRMRVATYQAISGAGRAALEAFDRGEGAVVKNVVPQIGSFDESGESDEERKVREESAKMLGLPLLDLVATCVRVPVRTAHSEAVFFTTERPVERDALAKALARAPSIVYHEGGIVTPRDVEGTDDVHVARLRGPYDGDDDAAVGREFSLWCCGDQLRKGAATNAVQILELLVERGVVR
ncbi:MAG: aspartate-semialdehyde dehydrogenase [Candidatus Tyrphobacter sp.]